jgi:hypothetical protein
MNRIIELLARTLSPDEREAVLGDLAECGDPPRKAFREVLGLVVRRQTAFWMQWRPWLALVLTSVAGLKLGTWCARKAHLNAVYIWMYANNWDWSLFEIPGFRHELSRNAAAITFFWLGIGLGAWTLGRILQWTSRDTAPVQAVIFTVLLFAAPTDPLIVLVNPPVFAHWYYRALPLIIKTMLVMLPCWRGLRTRRVA